MTLIAFANPSISLMLYYDRDKNSYHYANTGVKAAFSSDELPVLIEHYETTYFGPHLSQAQNSDEFVLSVSRRINLPTRRMDVYVETGFKMAEIIMNNSENNRQKASYLFLD